MLDGGDSRRLSQRRHGERGCRHPQVLRNLRVRNRVAHAQTRQALRLGEGAQNNDVLIVAVDVHTVQRGFFTFRHGGGSAELEVRLINHHGDAGGHLLQERTDLAFGDGGAGRVVGGADQDQAGAVGDGCRHGVQVV